MHPDGIDIHRPAQRVVGRVLDALVVCREPQVLGDAYVVERLDAALWAVTEVACAVADEVGHATGFQKRTAVTGQAVVHVSQTHRVGSTPPQAAFEQGAR